MWKLPSAIVACIASGLALSGVALAAGNYSVHATLGTQAEVPAPAGASGKGSFSGHYKENAAGATLTWTLSFSGLTGAAVAAHIHLGKPGKAGAVLVPLCGPCKNGQTGTATIPKAVVADLESGSAYVNVHTAKNQGGEIRGQVKVTEPSATPVLNGSVGPGFTITLKQNGATVKTLAAGSYKLVIADRASIHGWSLDGPNGYAKDFTAVPFVGTKTFTVVLAKGSYKFYCPPHESSMFGNFTVK